MIFLKKWVCDDGITIRNILRNVQPTIKTGLDALLKALQWISSKNKERGWGFIILLRRLPSEREGSLTCFSFELHDKLREMKKCYSIISRICLERLSFLFFLDFLMTIIL
jgi:hypothetical protein